MIKCWSSICDKIVCMYTFVCVREGACVCISTYVHCVCLIPIYTTLKIGLLLCFKADEADVVLFVRRLCFMGSLLFQERKSSHPGVKSRDEELSSATPPPPKPVNPCFKICDLCATEGVNAYKHKQPFYLPLWGSRGQTVSWELEIQWSRSNVIMTLSWRRPVDPYHTGGSGQSNKNGHSAWSLWKPSLNKATWTTDSLLLPVPLKSVCLLEGAAVFSLLECRAWDVTDG